VQTGVDLARDPQLAAGGFFGETEEPHPLLGRTFFDRLPLRFERTPVTAYRRSRVLGEDSAAVLGDWLGLAQDEVRRGEAEGYLG